MVVVRVTVDGREVSAFVLAEEGKVSSSGKSMVLGTANVKMVADDGKAPEDRPGAKKRQYERYHDQKTNPFVFIALHHEILRLL